MIGGLEDTAATLALVGAFAMRRTQDAPTLIANPQLSMIPLQALVLRYLAKTGLSIREVDRRSRGQLDKSTLSNISRGLVYQRPTQDVIVALRRWLRIPKPELDDALDYWRHRAEIIQQYDALTDADREQVDLLVRHLASRYSPGSSGFPPDEQTTAASP